MYCPCPINANKIVKTLQKDNLVPNTRKITGDYGEQLAANYLKLQGYTIIETNWRCNIGEIDIVAQHNEHIIFIEVRTRRTNTVDAAFASITPSKREKLIRAAHAYLDANTGEDALWRIDVIAIALPFNSKPRIEHVEDALGW